MFFCQETTDTTQLHGCFAQLLLFRQSDKAVSQRFHRLGDATWLFRDVIKFLIFSRAAQVVFFRSNFHDFPNNPPFCIISVPGFRVSCSVSGSRCVRGFIGITANTTPFSEQQRCRYRPEANQRPPDNPTRIIDLTRLTSACHLAIA